MFRHLCLAFGLAALCFNVSAKQKPLPMPLAQDLPVEIVLNQQELAVDVPATAAAMGMQFGLIGALIGSGIQNAQVKSAEARVVPIRDQLIAYRFNERLEAALRAKLASEGLSPNPAITVLQTPWDAVDAQNAQTVPLQALVIVPRYSIDSGFNQLAVRLTAQLVDRKIKPNGKIKSAYRLNRTYSFNFPLAESEADDNLPRWTAMGAARLAGLLDEGIAQTTDMLVHDFSAAGRAEREQPTKRKSVTVKGQEFSGLAVRQTPDWAWVRVGKGWMQTLQGYQPVSERDTAVAVAASTASPAPATPVASAPAPATVQGPASAQAPATTPAQAPVETEAPTGADAASAPGGG